ncbi:Spy/CpxP family protein refolding chaperone [Pseudomonas sp. RT4P38]
MMKLNQAVLSLVVAAGSAYVQGAQTYTSAQTHPPAHPPEVAAQNSAKAATDPIAELREKVTRLESVMAQGHTAMPPSEASTMPSDESPMGRGRMDARSQQGSSAGGMQGMSGASGMDDGMGMGAMENMEDGITGKVPTAKMPMMERMMMMGMSRMGAGMQGGSMSSALPGFPGASHIYHVGATGFFLDHPEHISLSVDQRQRLGSIKEAALLEQATMQRNIEQAEQALWVLTGSDKPDAGKIEGKLREIETLRADQRLAFVRGVGSAAEVLSEEQRKQLTGHLSPIVPPATGTGAGAGMESDM